MSLFHSSVGSIRSELGETKQDWKKAQDLLGQAISTLSQDLADFQKHMNTVMNKLQSDVYKLEEVDRGNKDRMNRMENQMGGMQQNLYSTTNDLILMKNETVPEPQQRKPPPPLERKASQDRMPSDPVPTDPSQPQLSRRMSGSTQNLYVPASSPAVNV